VFEQLTVASAPVASRRVGALTPGTELLKWS
jgi:hypothetical protein